MILEERGINTSQLKLEDMLSQHDDFKNEKNALETMLESRAHIAVFLPKFHCELNGIERVWGHSKCTTRAYCDYTIMLLCKNVPHSLDSIPIETIQGTICWVEIYQGRKWEKTVRKFNKEYKSHRRVGEND